MINGLLVTSKSIKSYKVLYKFKILLYKGNERAQVEYFFENSALTSKPVVTLI
jgi:hypothetical protein